MNTNLGYPIDVDFLDKLKKQSAIAHKQLENLAVSASIISPDLKISDYCHYLSLMFDVHKNTEEIIYPLLADIVSDLNERKKTQLVVNDLSFLNHKKKEPVLIFKSELYSIPFALGIVYVIEGSSLGGRFILKNVETIAGLDEQKGVSYFTGYGNKTGTYWKDFINILTSYEQQNNCSEEIIAGAIYGFDCIHNHFLNTVKNEN